MILFRKIFIVASLLIVASGAAAGTYPDEYYGPPLPFDGGCVEIEAYVPEGEWLDRNPWGMNSPEEVFLWLGELCVEGTVAVLEFRELAHRICEEPPFGVPPGTPLVCYAVNPAPLSYPDRHVAPWDPAFDPDFGFYISKIWNGEVFLYDSITYHGDFTATFVQGAFDPDLHPPFQFVESDDWTRWKFHVSPRVTLKVFVPWMGDPTR